MITNTISVAETAAKNGHGLSLSKGSWTTSLLAVALTITLISSKPEDSHPRLNFKMEEGSRKDLNLSINRISKNHPNKPKRM
jgi:hypothetical protein